MFYKELASEIGLKIGIPIPMLRESISDLEREASAPPMGMGVTGGLASDGEGVEDVLTPNI